MVAYLGGDSYRFLRTRIRIGHRSVPVDEVPRVQYQLMFLQQPCGEGRDGQISRDTQLVPHTVLLRVGASHNSLIELGLDLASGIEGLRGQGGHVRGDRLGFGGESCGTLGGEEGVFVVAETDVAIHVSIGVLAYVDQNDQKGQ